MLVLHWLYTNVSSLKVLQIYFKITNIFKIKAVVLCSIPSHTYLYKPKQIFKYFSYPWLQLRKSFAIDSFST